MSSKLTALSTNPSPLSTDLIYVVPAAGGNQYKAAIGAYPIVGSPASSADNAIAIWDGTTGKLLKNSTLSYDGTSQNVPSTATGGIRVFNTVDQVTNFERIELVYVTNTAVIRSNAGGTGTPRTLIFQARDTAGVSSQFTFRPTSVPFGEFTRNTPSSNTGIWWRFGDSTGTSTATSSTVSFVAITPTYNQASGTAANTDLLVNRTQTAIGSGTQRLLDLQVGGASMFSVSNTGVVTRPGGTVPLLTTSTAVTSGAGAQAGTLLNSPVAGNPTCWIPFNDNGTTRYIPAW